MPQHTGYTLCGYKLKCLYSKNISTIFEKTLTSFFSVWYNQHITTEYKVCKNAKRLML